MIPEPMRGSNLFPEVANAANLQMSLLYLSQGLHRGHSRFSAHPGDSEQECSTLGAEEAQLIWLFLHILRHTQQMPPSPECQAFPGKLRDEYTPCKSRSAASNQKLCLHGEKKNLWRVQRQLKMRLKRDEPRPVF